MQHRPLSIPGLPLAPSLRGLTMPEDITRATSSHPRRPIPPHPIWSATPPAAAVPATATAVGTGDFRKRPRLYPHGEMQPSPGRPRLQTIAAAAARPAPVLASAVILTPAAAVATDLEDGRPLFPLREYPKTPPKFFPAHQQPPTYHSHPLAIRTPLDVIRFFPMSVSIAALFAGLSGLFAGKIARHTFGSDLTLAHFVAGYLALFLLSLLIQYFSSKGQLHFSCTQRYLRLLVANAVLLAPHFIAYTVLTGISAN